MIASWWNATGHMGLARMAILVAALAVISQLLSASLVESTVSPNASYRLAQSLANDGSYEIEAWHRMVGDNEENKQLKMWHLPGEPLYLAVGMKVLPQPMMRYLHVPVTAALIVAVAIFAGVVFGPRVGLVTGIVAILQPFVLVHGPVWDDAFFGAAAYWSVAALASLVLVQARARASLPLLAACLLILILSALGAITRSQVTIALVALAIIVALACRSRPSTAIALSISLGVVLALGAWGYRNQQVSGELFFGSTHDGITLWESNYPHVWDAIQLGQVEALNSQNMQTEFRAAVGMSEIEANNYYKRLAMQRFIDHPLDVAVDSVRKVVVSTIGVAPQKPLYSPRNMAAIASTLLLALGAWMGLYAVRRHCRIKPRVFWMHTSFLMLLVFGMLAIGPIGLRYRLLFDGVLWSLCGLGVVRVIDHLKGR